MKLSELKKLVAILEEGAAGEDVDVVFTDYSRRGYPLLDMDRPVAEYQYANHLSPDRPEVRIPLDEFFPVRTVY